MEATYQQNKFLCALRF